MNLDISGKRILLLGIGFYDYETAISEELCRRGAKVLFIDAVYKSFLKKILLRVSRHLSQKMASNYLLNQIAKQPKDMDYIIIIKGDVLREEHISLLKRKYPNTRILLYLWDSINRISNSELLLKSFDRILTFDRVDAIKYNLVFRPLFYREYMVLNTPENGKYNISFIGWMHSNRYEILHKLKLEFEAHGIRYKFVLYTSRLSYYINRYIKRVISQDDSDFFVFKPISYDRYIQISQDSDVILDLSHPLQNGLTMRTIEAIGLRKKILTTNADIKQYPMIDRTNYEIIDPMNMDVNYHIFRREYVKSENDFYFSLSNFIDDIILAVNQ